LALDCSHSKKIEEHQGTIIAVISNVGTVFQLLSEEELDPTIKRLHYGGCGAGLVVAIAIAARKKAPLVAIAAGGLALVIDSGVTVFAAVTGEFDFLFLQNPFVHSPCSQAVSLLT
jgi:hypothetical protein